MTKEQARCKAKELVSKMTAEEKMSQLLYNSPSIERLGIKEYSCISFVERVLSKSYNKAILGIFFDILAPPETKKKFMPKTLLGQFKLPPMKFYHKWVKMSIFLQTFYSTDNFREFSK